MGTGYSAQRRKGSAVRSRTRSHNLVLISPRTGSTGMPAADVFELRRTMSLVLLVLSRSSRVSYRSRFLMPLPFAQSYLRTPNRTNSYSVKPTCRCCRAPCFQRVHRVSPSVSALRRHPVAPKSKIHKGGRARRTRHQGCSHARLRFALPKLKPTLAARKRYCPWTACPC